MASTKEKKEKDEASESLGVPGIRREGSGVNSLTQELLLVWNRRVVCVHVLQSARPFDFYSFFFYRSIADHAAGAPRAHSWDRDFRGPHSRRSDITSDDDGLLLLRRLET